ncbi:MAG TPA: DUF1385 domain-containing protein [Bacillota bacterium]|nr:DUF1385 domain-containing protein [Clostridiales bacterium]HPT85399.1 DUF1385 domain-containing protein [Bacillota bacterium]
MKNKPQDPKSRRIGTVGGQAVLEGVMMKSKDRYSVAVRLEDGDIDITSERLVPLKNKYKILGWPLIRGVVNFGEMLALSYKTLEISARATGVEDEASETKFEKWLREKFGRGIVDVIMVISTILGVGLGLGLFFFLPSLVTKGIDILSGGSLGLARNLIEGVIKIGIFVGYIALVSLIPDIRRTFEYHGAEHKSIFCYESGEELTIENVKKYSRFHPRCGTSFLIVMLLISVLLYSLPIFTWDNMLLRMLTKLIFLPLLVALGYEFIRYAGRHDNALVRALSAPGLWMQRLTTREPDERQIEVAIAALKSALPEEFPGFSPEKKIKTVNQVFAENGKANSDTANA